MSNRFKIKAFISAVFAFALVMFTGCMEDSDLAIQDNPQNGDLIPNQYMVVFDRTSPDFSIDFPSDLSYDQRNQMVQEAALKLLAKHGVADATIMNSFNTVMVGFTTTLQPEERQTIESDPSIELVEQDRFVALAPPPGKGKSGGGGDSGGTPDPQETPWGIKAVGGAHSGSGKRVWIIDTGVDQDHPDLNVNTSLSKTMFTSGRDSKSPDDKNGHGTHVAGTIAALDNNVQVVGVAAGAEVVGVKVLDSRGSGSYSTVIAGVDYVASNGSSGDVANMSLGGPASTALDNAVISAANNGILFALAAGNDATNAGNQSPARVNHSNVWTVSAHDSTGKFASFSNYGNPPVDYAAPGVSIKSLWKDGGVNTISGTSMASPHMAGVLIITGGSPNNSGSVSNDPDGTADLKVSIY